MKNNTRKETIKTIVIAALVSGIICFVAGVVYANKQHDQQTSAIHAAVEQVKSVK